MSIEGVGHSDSTCEILWLDEAFSKDYVDDLEAACCLTEDQVKVYFSDQITSADIDYYINPKVRQVYKIIVTWVLIRLPLLAYIDKAICKKTPHLRYNLLLKKCKELFSDLTEAKQIKFIEEYPYIAKKLSLSVSTTIDSAVKLAPSFDYSLWLSHSSWSHIVAACLLNETHPDDLRYTPYSDGTCAYHPPIGKERIIFYINLFKSWEISTASPMSWIEKFIVEGLEIPGTLWQAANFKLMMDIRHKKHEEAKQFLSNYPAITEKVNQDQVFTEKNEQPNLKTNDQKNPDSMAKPEITKPSQQLPKNEMDEDDANSIYLANPADRNPRLVEIAIQMLMKNTKLKLSKIHKDIHEQEKGKSDITIDSLKRIVKLNHIKREAKKRIERNSKSKKVN